MQPRNRSVRESLQSKIESRAHPAGQTKGESGDAARHIEGRAASLGSALSSISVVRRLLRRLGRAATQSPAYLPAAAARATAGGSAQLRGPLKRRCPELGLDLVQPEKYDFHCHFLPCIHMRTTAGRLALARAAGCAALAGCLLPYGFRASWPRSLIRLPRPRRECLRRKR